MKLAASLSAKNGSPQPATQRQPAMEDDEEELMQEKAEPAQQHEVAPGLPAQLKDELGTPVAQAISEDEEPLQEKPEPLQKQENKTGLPDNLKAGVEHLSGLPMDDVKVHYNSSQPKTVQALAYTQGTDIHVGPGQEQHLAHEAWHVAQQKQGRVQPTTQAKGVAINDEQSLETEADQMGERARQQGEGILQSKEAGGAGSVEMRHEPSPLSEQSAATTQLKWIKAGSANLRWDKLIDGVQWYFNLKTDRFIYTVIDAKALPSGSEELIQQNAGKQLSEEELDKLGFEEIEYDDGENIIEEIFPPSEEEAELNYRERQTRGELKPLTKVVSPVEVTKSLEDASNANWDTLDAPVATRAKRVFPIIVSAFKGGAVELTPDLLKKIRETLSQLKKGKEASKQVSEALSELEHIANILTTVKLGAPAVLGAQGPEWSPQQWGPIEAEVTHGQLPPLDIIRLEADAYYLSSDGVLHLDEVKDTPRALAQKAKDGDQIKRQVKWLKKAVIKNEKLMVKQVGYFVATPEPYFDDVLSAVVIANLKLIDDAQKPGLKFINIAGHLFSLAELKNLYDFAIDWLGKSRAALIQQGKWKGAATVYFGNVETALKMLGAEPLKATD
ncbi:MAG: hypothetical protein QOF02_491 [Blastocatellia bacterium]|nr:hypothetical protein [Blastocatellia bacterium]